MTLTAAMRPRFSIEWMAQSSQPAEPETSTASGPVAWGTRSKTLCTEPEICTTAGPAAWETHSETLSTEPETCMTTGPAAWGTRSETLSTEPETCMTTGPAAWGTRSETLSTEPETCMTTGPAAWGTRSETLSTEPETCMTTGPAAWGTRSETLPGFYCRQKSEGLVEAEHRGLDSFRPNNLPQTSACVQVTQSGFSSGTEEETSGYESEGGQVPSPPTHSDCTSTSPPSPPVGRRPRTAFTAEQIQNLERAFKKNAYLGTQDKMELCKKLNLSDKQIRNWFQNRRMKLKRSVQDALAHACQANMASHFLSYPELQTYRAGPYTRYHAAAAETPNSYLHPHSLQYTSPLPSTSALSLDSFYLSNSLPGAILPQVRGAYPTYPQYF